MPAREIQLDQIKDNPFQARQAFDTKSIASLAAAIKDEGFWNTTLQARKKGEKFELVFGHRRLRALRRLHAKTVRLEILDLTDEQMAMRGLEENFQREGLTDLEKSDAVAKAIEVLEQAGVKGPVERVAERLNLDNGWVSSLRKISLSMDRKNREPIVAGFITAKTAMAAKEFGGDEFVKTLAARGEASKKPESDFNKPTHETVASVAKAVRSIPDEKIRERVKAAVVSGKIDPDPKVVKDHARRLASASAAKANEAPPDLRIVIMRWTEEMKDFTKKLKEVKPYMDYVDEVAGIAGPFRKASEALVKALQDL